MDYWGCRYYIGLLTAARYHGANASGSTSFSSHDGRARQASNCLCRVKIYFITNRDLSKIPVQSIANSQEYVNCFNSRSYRYGFANYPINLAGLNHIVTVLAELQETMKPEKLLALAESHRQLAWKQRLGYLLELLDASELADVLKNHLDKQKRVDYIPLMAGSRCSVKAKRNITWRIIENAKVESDI